MNLIRKTPDTVSINLGAIIYENVEFHKNITIGEYSIVGKKHHNNNGVHLIVKILSGVNIGSFCTIYENVTIGENVFIDDYIRIGPNTTIGSNTRLLYGAKIYKEVEIGTNCIISGFICNRAIIKENSSVFGMLVHRYPRPKWGVKEESPIIGKNVVVGMGALIVGGVEIGDNSYIAAGAIVRKNIPEGSVIINKELTNVPLSCWNGRMSEDMA